MPVQTQMSSFAKKMGARVAQANAEHHDKPVDTGNPRLPPGIRNGVAKLSAMYTKEYPPDAKDVATRGQTFFRASAIALSPDSINGQKVAGGVTSIVIPMCDVPAVGQRKAKTFSDNYFEFQNLFKLLGVAPPNETPQTDPSGQKVEAYYFAAMKALTDPQRAGGPVYVSFSTRGWTPPATPAQPKPELLVFEDWHGLAEWNGQHDPAAGVVESPGYAPPALPSRQSAPITPTPQTQTAAQRGAAPPPTTGAPPQYQPGGDKDPADEVTSLVEVAMNDPEGATDDGVVAHTRLEEMAWASGWTKEQTAGATDWAQVGDMALNAPTAFPPPPAVGPSPIATPAIGSKWMFAKRTKDGARLKNNKGEEFPPVECEVVTVDNASKTCTLKTVKDGRDVVDIRSKQPVVVRWDWLQTAPPY